MNDISNGIEESVKDSNDIFKIYGKVLPVTEDRMKICAELGNGYVVEEKSKIASIVYDKLTKINRVYLSPSNCKPTPGVLEAIKNADSIIIGPRKFIYKYHSKPFGKWCFKSYKRKQSKEILCL